MKALTASLQTKVDFFTRHVNAVVSRTDFEDTIDVPITCSDDEVVRRVMSNIDNYGAYSVKAFRTHESVTIRLTLLPAHQRKVHRLEEGASATG